MTEGAVLGGVRVWLRLEGAAVLVAAVGWYASSGHGWGRFALLFLLPDLSFVGYLAGPALGAVVYNLAHSYVLPLAVAGVSATSRPELLPLAAIWLGHIGFDRMLGYGLKYRTAFGDTHLGPIGRGPSMEGR
jgi:hypothetical protein